MMTPKGDRAAALAGAFVFCMLVGGCVEWARSYQAYMEGGPESLIVLGVIAATGFVLALTTDISTRAIGIVLNLAFPTIILIRVLMDTAKDPTTHNLFPIEIVLALIIGLLAAWPPTWFGRSVRTLVRRRRAL
jgi:hypothetical protein